MRLRLALLLGALVLVPIAFLYLLDRDGPGGGYEIAVVYEAAEEPSLRSLARQVEEWGYVERVAREMAEPFRLPAGLQIRFKRCGEPQAYFDAGSSSLVFCYDLAQWFTFAFAPHIRTGEELSAAIWHAALFAIYHEYGHALIELFDLEPSGGAENLAHELSALALFESDEETVRVVAHGAGWLMVHASDLVPRIPYWQAHSFERERYEQLVCWAYGSDPDAFAALAGGRQLTAERAPNCREEYRALRRRWWGVLESAMR